MLLLVIGTGAAVGLHLGLLHLYMWKSHVVGPLLFFLGALCFSGMTYALWRWVFPRLPGTTFRSQITVEVAVSLVAYGVLSVIVVSIGAHMLGAPPLFGVPMGPEEHITITPQIRQGGVRVYALLPIVPSVLSTIVTYHLVWRRMETLQTRARELGELAATAQLAALRSQINPHFLFNSLNSIAQLIHVDPAKAEACVERRGVFLSASRAERDCAAFEGSDDERYLEIERARFEGATADWTSVVRRRQPPNLVLQPLVENAVKHGLSRKVGPGTLRIAARLVAGATLTVGDDGLGISSAVLTGVFERRRAARPACAAPAPVARSVAPAGITKSAPGAARVGCACHQRHERLRRDRARAHAGRPPRLGVAPPNHFVAP
jgi:signal transduction histidine kinase